MIRPDAKGIHTEVVDRIPFGNRANMKLVREPMGVHRDPFTAPSLHAHHPVPTLCDNSDPLPASGAFADVRIEPFPGVSRPRVPISSSHARKYTTMYTEHIGRQLLDHLGRLP